MGVKVHRLSDIDEATKTGTCSNCGRVRVKKKQDGWRCKMAELKWVVPGKKSDFSYRLSKKDHCEVGGFIPVNPIQLDVDHIDNNHKNNDLANLQTLCVNCHRLKTFNHRNMC